MNDPFSHGYAAGLDQYPIDCMKQILTRTQNNEWVKGWLEAEKEAENDK